MALRMHVPVVAGRVLLEPPGASTCRAMLHREQAADGECSMSQIAAVQTTILDSTPMTQTFVTVTDSDGRTGIGET